MNFLKTHPSLSALCLKQVVNTRLFFTSLFCLFALLSGSAIVKAANTEPDSLQDIIKLQTAPAGVVIEIVTWGGDNLEWALPRAKKYIQALQEKFPKLPVAIVTHGAEQFAITKDEKDDNKEVHQLVKSLGESGVPVHVCETFAGWRGLTADDFPDYVNVAAAGPAQVNDYLSLGYRLILIDEE